MDILYQIIPLSVLLLLLIYLSGWFSSAETALTNLTPVRLGRMKNRGVKNFKFIYKLKKEMNRTLIAILILNNVVNVLLSALSAVVAESLFHAVGVSIAVGVITFIIIIFGDIIPKSYAIRETEKVLCKKMKIIYYIIKVIDPLITFFIYLSRGILKLQGVSSKPTKLIISDESIMGLATLEQENGLIKKIERDIIYKVFTFGDAYSKDVMVPLTEVFTLSDKISFKAAKKLIAHHGFTRVPVLNTKKQVVGILYSKDLLGKRRKNLRKMCRKPMYTSISSPITRVFQKMQKKRIHMAIVRDKNGNHVGIVTLEDILEELVGEIYDEYFKTKYKK